MKNHNVYSTLLVVAFLFVIPLLFAPNAAFGTTEDNTSIDLIEAEFIASETDLARDEWQLNGYENEGFESWASPHTPSNLYTYRTTEKFSGFSTSNFSEGTRSLVMQSKAIDTSNPATAKINPSYWGTPTTYWPNLTVSFDWIIESLPVTTDGDYFRLRIEMGDPGTSYLTYYLGCDNTDVDNSSYYKYYMIDAASTGWNTFSRNITEDFFSLHGTYPTEFEYFGFDLYTESSDYSRIYLDDINVINGTNVVIGGSTNNGNFEDGSYWNRPGNDPSDISQSTIRQEGDYSLNATTISNGNTSNCEFVASPYKRLTSSNIDSFQFQWKIDEYAKATDDVYAYVSVECRNDTEWFTIYYPLCYGGDEFPLTYSGYAVINPSGFNTTGVWNQFDRSIWEDLTSFNSTSFIVVLDIEIKLYAHEYGARTSILFDDISYTCATLNDRGYEDQGGVGEEVWAWDLLSPTNSRFTVTDMTHSGSKAGNITVDDNDSWSGNQILGYPQINNGSDLWIDFWWRFENFTGLENDLVYLEVNLDDDEGFAYIFGNGSSVYIGNGFDKFIIVPDNGTEGTWFNFQRNIYDDYIMLNGMEPDTWIYELYLNVECDTDGRVEFLLDDVYMYIDPAPAIESLKSPPSVVQPHEELEITVDAIDRRLDTVLLHYALDLGPWTSTEMSQRSGNTFNATIPGQDYLTEVQYYVSANDTFGNNVNSLTDFSLFFSYIVNDTLDPEVYINSPSHESTVSGIASIGVIAEDLGSGINRVEIFIEEALLANLTSGPFLVNWDTTSLANGTYSITAIAYDEAGNSDQVTHIVTVQNAETPTSSTTPTEPQTIDPTFLLILAGVAGAVIVIIIVYFAMKKGKSS